MCGQVHWGWYKAIYNTRKGIGIFKANPQPIQADIRGFSVLHSTKMIYLKVVINFFSTIYGCLLFLIILQLTKVQF